MSTKLLAHNKYGAVKTIVDGRMFDSKKESARYRELKIMQLAGEICMLQCQPEFEICPSVRWNGRKLKKRVYRADFSYWEVKSGMKVVEDVKGKQIAVYSLKRSLFLHRYPEYLFKEI